MIILFYIFFLILVNNPNLSKSTIFIILYLIFIEKQNYFISFKKIELSYGTNLKIRSKTKANAFSFTNENRISSIKHI